MGDGFLRLRHHAVVGRDHQNHDVRCFRTAGTHGRERLVTRRVEERDDAARRFDMISADVLRNPARFARRHLGAPDVVEQRRLAVVNVTHHGHNRRTRQQFCVGDFAFDQHRFRIVQLGRNRVVTQFLDDDHRRFLVQHLVDGDHLAELHHRLDDFRRLHCHLVRQISDGNRLRHMHFTHDRLGRRLERCVLFLMLATALRATAPAAIYTAAGIAARLDATTLRCVVLPAAFTSARLLLVTCRRRRRCSGRSRSRLLRRRTRRCLTCRTRRLVQRTLGFGGLGRFDRLRHRCRFRRLDLSLARRVHHLANRTGFGFCLCAALADFFLLGARFLRSLTRCVFRFLRRFALRSTFCCRTLVVLLAYGRRGGRCRLRNLHDLLRLLLRCNFRCRSSALLRRFFFSAAALSFSSLLARLTLGFFALQLLLARLQFLRLLFEQLGFVTRFFFATLKFEVVRIVLGLGHMIRCIAAFAAGFIAANERALLAHLDLNGTSLTRGVGLLDLRRMPFRQRDLALVRISRAVRLAQVVEQTRLVRFGQGVVFARFGDARRLQLLEQHACRHFQFRGKLGYVVTRHSFLLMQGPIPCG